MSKKIYVIAGEASGDLYGSHLITHLRHESKEPLTIYGIGGDRIRQTGALEFFDLAHFHVTGLTDALKKLPEYLQASKTIFSRLKKIHPDLVVLIDNPGFNLHLAKKIHALGIPVVYFIAPQLWAWAPKRIFKIKQWITKVLVVFEFEKKVYEDQGIPVEWVGHPLKDLITHPDEKKPVTKKKKILISLLPGSRKGEIKMLLSIFLKTAKELSKKFDSISFALIKSPTLPKELYERLTAGCGLDLELVENNSYETIQASDLAIVCSGTATLECALLGTPMIISNRGTFLTYIIARKLIQVPYLGLPNLVLGQKRIPEFLQYEATPLKIAQKACEILTSVGMRQEMKEDLRQVSQKIGPVGATKRAAQEILRIL